MVSANLMAVRARPEMAAVWKAVQGVKLAVVKYAANTTPITPVLMMIAENGL
jgi:hypothetical protein